MYLWTKSFSYDDRLTKLGALTLEKSRTISDTISVCKIMRRFVNCLAADMGLTFRCTNTRKGHYSSNKRFVSVHLSPTSDTVCPLFRIN